MQRYLALFLRHYARGSAGPGLSSTGFGSLSKPVKLMTGRSFAIGRHRCWKDCSRFEAVLGRYEDGKQEYVFFGAMLP